MRKLVCIPPTLLALSLICACIDPSAQSVFLPEGDAARGKEVFQELRCYTCHPVKGMDFPPPGASPPTNVVLGEKWDRKISDNELVTSIINPSHKIDPRYEKERVQTTGGTGSRMGNYAYILTVQQLADLVAMLREVNDANLRKK